MQIWRYCILNPYINAIYAPKFNNAFGGHLSYIDVALHKTLINDLEVSTQTESKIEIKSILQTLENLVTCTVINPKNRLYNFAHLVTPGDTVAWFECPLDVMEVELVLVILNGFGHSETIHELRLPLVGTGSKEAVDFKKFQLQKMGKEKKTVRFLFAELACIRYDINQNKNICMHSN